MYMELMLASQRCCCTPPPPPGTACGGQSCDHHVTQGAGSGPAQLGPLHASACASLSAPSMRGVIRGVCTCKEGVYCIRAETLPDPEFRAITTYRFLQVCLVLLHKDPCRLEKVIRLA